jgi:PEP-CTERM motif
VVPVVLSVWFPFKELLVMLASFLRAALLSFFALLVAQPAQAININSGDILENSNGNWKVTFPASVKLDWEKPDNVNLTGKLKKEVTFTTLDPISIAFEQTAKQTSTVVPQVFFNIVEDKAKNQTTTDWADFHLTLKDEGIELDHTRPSDFHPKLAHFHTHQIGSLEAKPLSFVEGGDKDEDVATKSFILLGKPGELVKIGETETITDFRIHEWMNQTATGLRKFEFIEQPTPVPEPSTLLLLGSSLAGLGGFAWRRQRRK